MKITEILDDKKVLIWGYAREGKSTESFIKKHCHVKSLDIFEGKENELDTDKYDVIIKSPGIRVEKYIDKYTSQTELFLAEFASQTIGITGTKGKSTTSSMLYCVLSRCTDNNVLLVGNIGLPCLDYYSEIDENTIIVFEMSCHQLLHQHYSPHVAVFLNLYQDHLDYYGTMEKYFQAKENITTHQTKDDHFFYGDNVPDIKTDAASAVIFFNDAIPFDMLLKGKHNQFNATFVYKIATEIFNCDKELVRAEIEAFHSLPHRLEYVGTCKGVKYYNDSISTIPEAAIRAIDSLDNVKTVLIGGMDRHIDYSGLVEYVKDHSTIQYIFSYESGKRIYEEVKDLKYTHYCDDLDGSVSLAMEITPAGASVLFSPAAASYGYFKNFEERGEYYKKLLKDAGFDNE